LRQQGERQPDEGVSAVLTGHFLPIVLLPSVVRFAARRLSRCGGAAKSGLNAAVRQDDFLH
jgi:hypothetical protein